MAAGIVQIVFLIGLGIAAWQDQRELSVSKKFLFGLGILAILGRCLIENEQITLWDLGVSLLPGLFLLGFGWLSHWQIGIGDGVTILVIGLWLGLKETVTILLLGLFLCSIVCAGLVLFRKAGRKTELPFIPFLWIACLIGRILEWG